MKQPLAGVRALDLTNVLAGPFCCHQLAHMGADVIKVEAPGAGDLARQLGADPGLNDAKMGVSFLAQNAGKRSIVIDLKQPQGVKLLHRLVETADILVENFRPGVMDRLGVGYSALQEINPKLIYCAISGFGQDGPMRDAPAYDQIIQGMSGVMSMTGGPETAPYRVGFPICDTLGGLTAAFAIASALAQEEAERGCFIDVSMLEATLAAMGWAVSNYLNADVEPAALGNDNVTASPSGTFKTGDGLINIAANKQEQFDILCDTVGRPNLKTDPRFETRQARLDNRRALSDALEDALAARPAVEWRRLLNEKGVPAGQVLSVAQALSHPQIAERGMIGAFAAPPGVGRDIRIARPGVKLNGETPRVETPPPRLGEHTDTILSELGFGDDEINTLRQERIVT